MADVIGATPPTSVPRQENAVYRAARDLVSGKSNRAVVPSVRRSKIQSPPEDQPPPPGPYGDPYPTRLAKLIPVEITGAFIAIDNSAHDYLLIGSILLLPLVPLYTWFVSRNRDPALKPRWFSYVLSMIAYPIWAMAIDPSFAATFHVQLQLTTLLLILGTVAFPALDVWLDARLPR